MQFLSNVRIEYDDKFIASNECVDGGEIVSVDKDEMFDKQKFIYDTKKGALHSATCSGFVIELKDSNICESDVETATLLKLATVDNGLYQKWWALNPFESTTDINYICLDEDVKPNNGHPNLAKIRSKRDNDMFTAFYMHHDGDRPWIGGSDRIQENIFLFEDGSPLTYFNWAQGEPNDSWASEDCIQMWDPPGTWNDRNCDHQSASLLSYPTDESLAVTAMICEKPCTLADVFQESTQFWKYKHSNNPDEAPNSYFGVEITDPPAFIVNADTDKCLAMTTVEAEDNENGLRNIIETVDCEVNPNLNLWLFTDTGEKPPHSSDLETKYCVGNVSTAISNLNFDFPVLFHLTYNLLIQNVPLQFRQGNNETTYSASYNGSYERANDSLEIQAYRRQDHSGGVHVNEHGEITMFGNTWKTYKLSEPIALSRYTRLSLDMTLYDEAHNHAICFDEDQNLDTFGYRYRRCLQVAGTRSSTWDTVLKINLALKRPTTSSKTVLYGDSENAVDGDKDQYWKNEDINSIAETKSDEGTMPWWQVDLEGEYKIDEVVIYPRLDSEILANFKVSIFSDAGLEKNTTVNFNGDPVKFVKFDSIRGSKVKVELLEESSDATLSLAEVQVFGSIAQLDEKATFDVPLGEMFHDNVEIKYIAFVQDSDDDALVGKSSFSRIHLYNKAPEEISVSISILILFLLFLLECLIQFFYP